VRRRASRARARRPAGCYGLGGRGTEDDGHRAHLVLAAAADSFLGAARMPLEPYKRPRGRRACGDKPLGLDLTAAADGIIRMRRHGESVCGQGRPTERGSMPAISRSWLMAAPARCTVGWHARSASAP